MARPVPFLSSEEDHLVRPSLVFRTTVRRTERDAGSLQSGCGKCSHAWIWVVILALLLLILSACAGHFERYHAGNVELWIGDQMMVQKECERRGVALYSNDTKVLGCTDFGREVIVSVQDPKIIAHEMCHWTLWTASHEACPTPVWRAR
jgi:hypothetical protein